MTSSGQDPSEMNAERARTDTRSVEPGLRCSYPNERRERNQIYTLLNISNSVSEEEEQFSECANGTGWEEAVQGWSKTPPFAYLQAQRRARKTKMSEPLNGCIYCADLLQGLDRAPEQNARTAEQLKPDFRLGATSAATESVSERKQPLLGPSAAATSPAADEAKRDGPYGRTGAGQASQGEKRKMTLKEAQAALSERRFFVMKESPLFQAEKKTVPIKEYNILPLGKPKSLEALKGREGKSHESPSSSCGPVASEATVARSSLVLPPVKDAAPKTGPDPPARRRQATLPQASEKGLSEPPLPVAGPRGFRTQEPAGERAIHTVYEALKEQMKMHEMASLVPRLAEPSSLVARGLGPCCWHGALFPDKRPGPDPAARRRRHSHPNSVNFPQPKAAQGVKAGGGAAQEPCARSWSHAGTKRQREPKAPEIPLLSGLFPSLTVSRLTVAPLPSRLT